MATLHLIIDLVDTAEKYKNAGAELEEGNKKNDDFWSWLPWQKINMLLARQVYKSDTTCSIAKIAVILRDFLQPDSKISTKRATETILELIPANAPECREICDFGKICVELAEQIPYDHPSQLKFVMLLQKLGRSPKFMAKYPLNSKENVYESFQLLWESIGDIEGPDEFPISEWVNIVAFEAKLFAAGVLGYSPGSSFVRLRYVFESKKMTEAPAWERNAEIMGVAQWIIWHGQTIFKFIIYDDDCNDFDSDSEKSDIKRAYAIGDLLEGVTPVIEPRSVERWRHWKTCFEAVETMPDAIDECKMLASRAARLMGALEESMLF